MELFLEEYCFSLSLSVSLEGKTTRLKTLPLAALVYQGLVQCKNKMEVFLEEYCFSLSLSVSLEGKPPDSKLSLLLYLWALAGSNCGPPDYESGALTN